MSDIGINKFTVLILLVALHKTSLKAQSVQLDSKKSEALHAAGWQFAIDLTINWSRYPIGQMVHNLNKINKHWKQFIRKASSACFQQTPTHNKKIGSEIQWFLKFGSNCTATTNDWELFSEMGSNCPTTTNGAVRFTQERIRKSQDRQEKSAAKLILGQLSAVSTHLLRWERAGTYYLPPPPTAATNTNISTIFFIFYNIYFLPPDTKEHHGFI